MSVTRQRSESGGLVIGTPGKSMEPVAFLNELVAIEKRLLELADVCKRVNVPEPQFSMAGGYLEDSERTVRRARERIWRALNS